MLLRGFSFEWTEGKDDLTLAPDKDNVVSSSNPIQIKNIKLHIVTDIKNISGTLLNSHRKALEM